MPSPSTTCPEWHRNSDQRNLRLRHLSSLRGNDRNPKGRDAQAAWLRESAGERDPSEAGAAQVDARWTERMIGDAKAVRHVERGSIMEYEEFRRWMMQIQKQLRDVRKALET